ncbi:hypothetical protein F3Y22_tig00111440pilonHSYRG00140 [Hibiscus syriacus]|uniref:Disease resistance N-terminal domain-containing protein n=1 Tax=Hibiscus syriacus TaxID=106335 RepID=A0A6A2YIH3_HIBSY|nr:hypothetical protein F3Y22_tig00111440pilonHSYRG00140 [Hibiscus syriacus]
MWNFKDHLQDLISIVSAISVVLLDAEEQTVSNNLVKDCLEKLKDALYDADDLLDDILTEALRKYQMSGNNLTREAIKVVLSSIQNETKMLNFVESYQPEETPFMAKKEQHTHSFVRKDEIIGRDDDKANSCWT